jgi:hypothetical protein
MNTPVDTGALRDAWVLQQSENEITIINDQQDLLSFHYIWYYTTHCKSIY